MAHSSLADINVWEELSDEQRGAIRRLAEDGLGPITVDPYCDGCRTKKGTIRRLQTELADVHSQLQRIQSPPL